MTISRIMLSRSTKANVSCSNNQNRSVSYLQRAAINAVNRIKIMTITGEDLPSVALETLLRIVVHRERRRPFDRDAVRIVNENKAVELHRARPAAGLVGNTLLHIAVAAENPRLITRTGLLRGELQARAHGDALTERAGRNFYAAQKTALGVTRAARTELTEILKLIHRKTGNAGKVKKRINERARVTAGKHKTVAPGPFNVIRRGIQKFKPEGDRKIGHAEGSAGVTGVGLVDHVGTKTANRVCGKFQLFVGNFHNNIL